MHSADRTVEMVERDLTGVLRQGDHPGDFAQVTVRSHGQSFREVGAQ